MFTTAVHSVRTKKDLLKIYNYLKNPQEILEQDKDNIDFYINVEKSRNSIKNYDIHDEKMEIDFKWNLSGYEELKGKEEWFMDTMVGNSLDRTPCAYHVYQAFSKGSVNVSLYENYLLIDLSFFSGFHTMFTPTFGTTAALCSWPSRVPQWGQS